jgi:hypothetical protein
MSEKSINWNEKHMDWVNHIECQKFPDGNSRVVYFMYDSLVTFPPMLEKFSKNEMPINRKPSSEWFEFVVPDEPNDQVIVRDGWKYYFLNEHLQQMSDTFYALEKLSVSEKDAILLKKMQGHKQFIRKQLAEKYATLVIDNVHRQAAKSNQRSIYPKTYYFGVVYHSRK